MIALTCAATGNTLYINPKKIIALEEGILERGKNTWAVCRVWIGPGSLEFFPVKEKPTEVISIICQTRVDSKYYE